MTVEDDDKEDWRVPGLRDLGDRSTGTRPDGRKEFDEVRIGT